MRQLTLDVRPVAEPSLDNFVAGANGELVARLRQLATDPAPCAILLWGPARSGRSHLLQAVVAAARISGQNPCLLAAGAIPADLAAAHGELLAVDDVEYADAAGQVALFRAFNDMPAHRLRLLLSAAAPPRALALREDLRTRLGAALVFQVHPLGEDDAARSLRQHASERGLELAPEIVAYLLRHGRRDLPFLLAVLDALDETSLARQRPITLPMVRELLDAAGPGG